MLRDTHLIACSSPYPQPLPPLVDAHASPHTHIPPQVFWHILTRLSYYPPPHIPPQVFWHILTRLSYYRELHVRSQAPLDTSVSGGEEGRAAA